MSPWKNYIVFRNINISIFLEGVNCQTSTKKNRGSNLNILDFCFVHFKWKLIDVFDTTYNFKQKTFFYLHIYYYHFGHELHEIRKLKQSLKAYGCITRLAFSTIPEYIGQLCWYNLQLFFGQLFSFFLQQNYPHELQR